MNKVKLNIFIHIYRQALPVFANLDPQSVLRVVPTKFLTWFIVAIMKIATSSRDQLTQDGATMTPPPWSVLFLF